MKTKIKHLLFATLFFVIGVLCGYVLGEMASQDLQLSQWWHGRGVSGRGQIIEK